MNRNAHPHGALMATVATTKNFWKSDERRSPIGVVDLAGGAVVPAPPDHFSGVSPKRVPAQDGPLGPSWYPFEVVTLTPSNGELLQVTTECAENRRGLQLGNPPRGSWQYARTPRFFVMGNAMIPGPYLVA